MSRPLVALPAWAKHVLVAGGVAAVAASTYIPAFGFPPLIPPFNLDNVAALHLASQRDPTPFLTDPAEYYFRPVAYLSLWIQYQIHGLRPSFFFGVNIAVWIACALCAYCLVFRHTASALSSGAAALAMLVDDRATTALIWIVERQSTLVCLLGGLALLIAYRLPRAGARRGLAVTALTMLLLAAALSKEYGLTFSAAVAVAALVTRPDQRRALLVAPALAIAAYSLLRWGLAGDSAGLGGSTGFCESMGYLDDEREVCYGELDLQTRVLQHAWNVGATLVATLLPSLFGGTGAFLAFGADESFAVTSLLFPAAVAACAVVGWIKHPRITLPFLTLVVANALLSFALFRSRNQLVGVFGLYVSAGIGFIPALRMLEDRARTLARRLPSASASRAFAKVSPAALGVVVLAVGFAAGILSRSADVRTNIEGEGADYARQDPCREIGNFQPPMGREIPEALRRKFGIQPVACPGPLRCPGIPLRCYRGPLRPGSNSRSQDAQPINPG